jgi:hypothetical protein
MICIVSPRFMSPADFIIRYSLHRSKLDSTPREVESLPLVIDMLLVADLAAQRDTVKSALLLLASQIENLVNPAELFMRRAHPGVIEAVEAAHVLLAHVAECHPRTKSVPNPRKHFSAAPNNHNY